jgi:2',3'-cyclic-nucleotide 2'-phosphodiesterase (5'-nucleotidase family)
VLAASTSTTLLANASLALPTKRKVPADIFQSRVGCTAWYNEGVTFWSRRRFLQRLSQAGVFCAVPSLSRAAQLLDSDTVTVSIFHTTDLHGHILPTADYDGTPDVGGLARCVTQIRRWRRKNRNTILIDVGDVYQGTEVGLRSKGQLMIDLFNHLRYDAWVIGNHEFDWGMEPFRRTLEASRMPVLAANTMLEGKAPGDIIDRQNPLAKVRSFIIKEVDGIRIAIVGVTTPGMPFWFRPEYTRGLDFSYPVEPVRRAIAKAKGEGAHAIVLAGHMGLKMRSGGDDFANSVMSLTAEFPDIAVFLGGHTHQNIPSRITNGVLLTQANHYGIHVGRVDLLFDRNSKRLLHRQARCEFMDSQIGLDHIVMSRARGQLAESEAALNTPIGELTEPLSASTEQDAPNDVEKLIGAAIMECLCERGVKVDGAFHGLFDDKSEIPAGPKTVNDLWSIIPYENYLVTAELTPEEIMAVMEETYSSRERRSLLGFNVRTAGEGVQRKVTSLSLGDGRPLERARRYVIAFNTFDSRSAGHRFMRLRNLLESGATNCRPHDVQTRDTLIDYFRRHQVVHRVVAPELAPAA